MKTTYVRTLESPFFLCNVNNTSTVQYHHTKNVYVQLYGNNN